MKTRASAVIAPEAEALRAEILEINDLPEPTDEQVERAKVALEEYKAREAELADAKRYEADIAAVRAASLEPSRVEAGSFTAPNVTVRKDPFENVGNDMGLRFQIEAGRSNDDTIARALNAVEDTRKLYRGVTDEQVEAAVRKIETVPGVAAYALAVGAPAYRSAFQTWMQHQGQNVQYTPEQADAVRASMSLTSAAGGYALPFLLDPTLIPTGTVTADSLREVARVVQGTQNVWHGVSVGNATTYWVAENTALTDGTPTFAGPSVTAAKLTCYVTASYEIFEDTALQAQLPEIIANSMAYAENTTFVTGSGSGAPKGIVTCLSGTSAVTITCTTRGQFDSASAADVFALLNAVPTRYEDTATWVGNKATFNRIRQMSTASQGSFFWTNFNNQVVGNRTPLLGSPTLQSSDMLAAQTSGTKALVLGDFSQFVIYDRIGTTLEFVQNVVDTNGLPTGTRGLIAHKRVGSDVTDQNAFRILNT